MTIICLVLDSLRSDCAPPEGGSLTPHLNSFAEDAVVFENAVATGSWTVPSHGSLFTGEYPSVHGATADTKSLPKGEFSTTADCLSDCGYRTVCVTSNPWLTEQFNIVSGFDEIVNLRDSPPLPDVPDPRESGIQTDISMETIKQILQWSMSGNPVKRLTKATLLKFFYERTHPDASDVVDALEKQTSQNDGDLLLFANLMDAHEPYFDGDEQDGVSWNLHSIGSPPTFPAERIESAYDRSVQELDEELGRYFNHLREKGLYEDSLIIVLGDHGQALGEHDYWGHGTFLYDCLIDVPLLVKPPGKTGESRQVSEMISLRKIHEMVTQGVRDAGFGVEQIARDYTEPVVVAESAGPHMNCRYPSDAVDEGGYRVFKSKDWSAIEYGSTESVEVLSSCSSITDEAIVERVTEIKTEHDLVFDAKSEVVDVDASTEEHLKELGYL